MASGYRADLTSGAAATGSTKSWPGGKGLFMAEATWAAGSAKLQAQSPNGTWIDVPTISLTANGMVAFELPAGQIRAITATGSAFFVYAISM